MERELGAEQGEGGERGRSAVTVMMVGRVALDAKYAYGVRGAGHRGTPKGQHARGDHARGKVTARKEAGSKSGAVEKRDAARWPRRYIELFVAGAEVGEIAVQQPE
ncbi:hypothetical protein ERJ75_001263000 [Trypanosoma vivax]|nr:hypothetical protein ERJ75_001263000 [Trypanosoma vivax]